MRWRIFLLAVGSAVGADWLGCRLLAHRVHAAFDQWAATLTTQGWSVHEADESEDGWPFGARLTVRDLTLAGGRAMVPGGLDLRSALVVVSLPLSHPFRLAVDAQGRQFVRLANLPPVTFEAEHLTASVKLWRHPVDSIDIDAAALAGGWQTAQDVRVDRLHAHLTAERGFSARTTAQLTLQARGVQLPDDGRWPLGASINRLGFDLSLASPALSGQGAADQARAWRDWGGTLALRHLDVRWGPLTLATSARLGLDDRLQPAGGGTAEVSGWASSLDALARAGTVPPGVAQTAKAVLGLMSVKDGTESLSLPFTLRDSTLSVGKVPLMRLSTVAWGGA